MAQIHFQDNAAAVSVGTIYCIGRNYAEHARELNNPVPQAPIIFLKPASSLIFDGQSVIIPAASRDVHHEVEMVALIGKSGKRITLDAAPGHIAGYGIGIDVTARDIQQRAKEKSHPWAVAKGYDTFAPLSEFVPAALVDPAATDVALWVNDERRQYGNTRDMLFPVHHLVAYLSTIFTLMPGDLVFTGTPAGVGPLQEGDRLRAVLGDDLVTLAVDVKQEPA